MLRMIALATLAFTTLPSAALAASADRAPFGTLPDGSGVEIVTLTNAHGMKARVLSYGAILQGVDVADRDGKLADVTLGYRDMRGYLTAPNYFGATVGRYANRIKAGRFTLDGHAYTL
eukprot:gene39952-48822_t